MTAIIRIIIPVINGALYFSQVIATHFVIEYS